MAHEREKSERGNFKATCQSPLVLRIMTGVRAGRKPAAVCGIVPPSLASESFNTMEEKAWRAEKGSPGRGAQGALLNWNPRLNYFI